MSKSTKSLTKDNLVGMKVIDSEGNLIGAVKDVAFTVGKFGISLNVENKKGEIVEVAWEKVQSAGDFILLKPPIKKGTQPQEQATHYLCPVCKKALTFIDQYQRWYCYQCKKYA
jgi:sporulation protein YlmC with PRC-barrel domain